MSKKNKKSKDLSRCCKRCNYFDCRNKEDPICSITAESTKEDCICKNFNSEITTQCQHCGCDITYSNKDSYYLDVHKFTLDYGGNQSGQNIRLCRRCSNIALDLFDTLLLKLKNRTV